MNIKGQLATQVSEYTGLPRKMDNGVRKEKGLLVFGCIIMELTNISRSHQMVSTEDIIIAMVHIFIFLIAFHRECSSKFRLHGLVN